MRIVVRPRGRLGRQARWAVAVAACAAAIVGLALALLDARHEAAELRSDRALLERALALSTWRVANARRAALERELDENFSLLRWCVSREDLAAPSRMLVEVFARVEALLRRAEAMGLIVDAEARLQGCGTPLSALRRAVAHGVRTDPLFPRLRRAP
jgi:hypothetical protein